jgi:hypothetical protein
MSSQLSLRGIERRLFNMNGKQAKTSTWLVLGSVVLIAILALLVYQVGFAKQQAYVTGEDGKPVTPVVTSAATMSFVGTDKLSQGTAVSGTQWVSINSKNSYKASVTSASPYDTVNVLFVNNTAYHNVLIENYKLNGNIAPAIEVKALGNASITMTVFNTNNQVMDANGASTNQSASTGGSYNMQIRLDGQDKKSTQGMLCILESSDGTKADKMTLNGFGATFLNSNKPASYSLIGSTSAIWVYDVPAIEGAVSPTGTIGITSKTGQDLSGTSFQITCRTKEYFVDATSGEVVYGIEDSTGTAKSMASYSFKDYFD